jgi:hypothetical protein
MTHLFGIRVDGVEGDNIRLEGWRERLGWLTVHAILLALWLWSAVGWQKKGGL